MNKGVRVGVTAAGAVYSCLAVALYVHKASSVELTANETVRLDRVAHSDTAGFVAEQYNDLIKPGGVTLRLEPGVYHFRSATDVTVAAGQGVEVVPLPGIKNPWPDPEVSGSQPPAMAGEQWAGHATAFSDKGDGRPDRVPELTVVRR